MRRSLVMLQEGGRHACRTVVQSCAKRRQSGTAQWQKRLARLATNSLHQQHCRVTDTIDGKQHRIGAADKPLQYPAALFDTTVMVQKGGTGALSQQDRMNLVSGDGETSSRLPAFSLFLPGSCPNNRNRRSTVIAKEDTGEVYGEQRFRAWGRVDDEYYVVAYTWRVSVLRIISVEGR